MRPKSSTFVRKNGDMRLIFFLVFTLLVCGCTPSSRTDNKAAPVVCDTLLRRSVQTVGGVEYLILTVEERNARVLMADSVIPSIGDTSVALCVEAAFTGECLATFSPRNVAGDYVVEGRRRHGYKSKYSTGLLSTAGGPHIVSAQHSRKETTRAEREGASLIGQMLLVEHGKEVYNGRPIKLRSQNIYRAAYCMQDGRFAVIQSLTTVRLQDFIHALTVLGTRDALYLDMGGGWNYGWYRETTTSPAVELFPYRSPYQTNWLVVRHR